MALGFGRKTRAEDIGMMGAAALAPFLGPIPLLAAGLFGNYKEGQRAQDQADRDEFVQDQSFDALARGQQMSPGMRPLYTFDQENGIQAPMAGTPQAGSAPRPLMDQQTQMSFAKNIPSMRGAVESTMLSRMLPQGPSKDDFIGTPGEGGVLDIRSGRVVPGTRVEKEQPVGGRGWFRDKNGRTFQAYENSPGARAKVRRGEWELVPEPKEEAPESTFDNASKLRKEFEDTNKSFTQVRDAYGRVISATRDPSPAGDLALIFNFMKMLDPGSTVREGEFANAENAGSVPQRIRAQYNKVATGNRLDPTMRQDFMKQAGGLFESQKGFYEETFKRYSDLAETYDIPQNEVVRDLTAGVPSYGAPVDPSTGSLNEGMPGRTIPNPGGQAIAAPEGTPTPQTDQEFQSLPRGSLYIDPEDGKLYRKM